MIALNYMIYFLAIYGASWVITSSKITLFFREWLAEKSDTNNFYLFVFLLTNCIVCTSWWVTAFSLLTPFPYQLFKYEYFLMYLYLPFVSVSITLWLKYFEMSLNDEKTM